MKGNPDSGIQEILAYGIRNIAQKIRNPTSDWNLSSTDKDRNPVPGIHGMESRIQDCPGFRYMGRDFVCSSFNSP